MYNIRCFRWREWHVKLLFAFILSLGGAAIVASSAYATDEGLGYAYGQHKDWKAMGGGLDNGHHNKFSGINKQKATELMELCKIEHTPLVGGNPAGNVLGKPTIVDNNIYWADRGDTVGAHKVIRHEDGTTSCQEMWRVKIGPLLFSGTAVEFDTVSQVSPAYYEQANGDGALLYTAGPGFFTGVFGGGWGVSPKLYALDANTGNLLWELNLINDPSQLFPGGEAFAPSVLSSPRVYKGHAYFGISSANNVVTEFFPVPITARGHMFKVDLGLTSGTPAIVGVAYSVPARPAYLAPGERWFAGGGVWSNSPSIIPGKDLVIFGTGQLYDYSEDANTCMNRVEPVNITDPATGKMISTQLKGETGKGAIECYEEIAADLEADGIDPVMTSSVVALNISDFSVAWHANTQGFDSWRLDCGLEEDFDCNALPQPLLVPGPDWDIGGNAPVAIKLEGQDVVLSHNKGGTIFWINAQDGEIFRKADVCVGSSFGGTHWGFGYDIESKTILAACANGGNISGFGGDPWVEVLARSPNGLVTCMTGSLNAIDARTGDLKWQVLPAASQHSYPGDALDGTYNCPAAGDYAREDIRFKYGLNHDIVHKNVLNASVPVIVMPEPANISDIPLAGSHISNSNGIAASSQGVAYWPVNYGTIYAVDIKTGEYLNQLHCDSGFIYEGASVANGLVSFGCGATVPGPIGAGQHFMVFGLEDKDD